MGHNLCLTARLGADGDALVQAAALMKPCWGEEGGASLERLVGRQQVKGLPMPWSCACFKTDSGVSEQEYSAIPRERGMVRQKDACHC